MIPDSSGFNLKIKQELMTTKRDGKKEHEANRVKFFLEFELETNNQNFCLHLFSE